MTQVIPAFWVRYRGTVDPQIPNTTSYVYTINYTIVGLAPTALGYTVLGPPQLNKQRFMEINWSPIVGLIAVTVTRGGINIFQSSGAEQGFRDEGQFLSATTGALQQ